MRRLVAAVAVTSALLVAGCSSDKTATTAGTPAVSAGAAASGATTARPDAGAAAAADAALAGNTKAICTQARTTGRNAAVNFTQDQKLLADAGKAKDKAAVAAAREKATRDVQNYAYALQDMSKLVADPAAKKALATMSASVTALKGDVTKLGPETQGRLAGTLAKACGNG
jgi:DNA topoisomerase IB